MSGLDVTAHAAASGTLVLALESGLGGSVMRLSVTHMVKSHAESFVYA